MGLGETRERARARGDPERGAIGWAWGIHRPPVELLEAS